MKEGLILWRHHRLYLGLWFNVKDVLLGPPGQNDVPGPVLPGGEVFLARESFS